MKRIELFRKMIDTIDAGFDLMNEYDSNALIDMEMQLCTGRIKVLPVYWNERRNHG